MLLLNVNEKQYEFSHHIKQGAEVLPESKSRKLLTQKMHEKSTVKRILNLKK